MCVCVCVCVFVVCMCVYVCLECTALGVKSHQSHNVPIDIWILIKVSVDMGMVVI